MEWDLASATVSEIMKACKFSEEVSADYIAKMHEEGYESVQDLKDMTLEEFVECGLKKGHAKRLVKEFKKASTSSGQVKHAASSAAEPAPALSGAASGSGAAAVRALKQPEDIVNFENGATQERLSNGATMQTDADGTKIFVFADGHKKQLNPDGSMIEVFNVSSGIPSTTVLCLPTFSFLIATSLTLCNNLFFLFMILMLSGQHSSGERRRRDKPRCSSRRQQEAG